MDIDRLQKALTIMNKDCKGGFIYAEHDEITLFPSTDYFTKEEAEKLESLGFVETDEGGWMCFT